MTYPGQTTAEARESLRSISSQCFSTCQATSVLSARKCGDSVVPEWVLPGVRGVFAYADLLIK